MNQNKNIETSLDYTQERAHLSPVEHGRIAMQGMTTFPVEGRGEAGSLNLSVDSRDLGEPVISGDIKEQSRNQVTGYATQSIKRVSIVEDRHARIRRR